MDTITGFPASPAMRKITRSPEAEATYQGAMQRLYANPNWKAALQRSSGGGNGKGETTEKKGMKELFHVILDLQRDIKKISDAQSLQGAQRVARRFGNGHQAKQGDFNNDGIPDVVIYDKHNNPVVINGYTTKQSKWPMMHHYFTANPTKTQRKATPFNQWYDTAFGVKYDNPNDPGMLTASIAPEWAVHAKNKGFAIKKPKNRSAYQVFSSKIMKVLFNEYIASLKLSGEALKASKKAFISVCAWVWNWMIMAPVMMNEYGDDALDFLIRANGYGDVGMSAEDQVIYKKLKGSKEIKAKTYTMVRKLYGKCVTGAHEVLDVYRKCIDNGYKIYQMKVTGTPIPATLKAQIADGTKELAQVSHDYLERIIIPEVKSESPQQQRQEEQALAEERDGEYQEEEEQREAYQRAPMGFDQQAPTGSEQQAWESAEDFTQRVFKEIDMGLRDSQTGEVFPEYDGKE